MALVTMSSSALQSRFVGLKLGTANAIAGTPTVKLHAQARVVCAVAAPAPAVLPVVAYDGENSGETVELNLRTARPETAKAVVHRAVVAYMQNKRQGSASTKTRAEVRGGGKKPFKQKGTGNARMGSKRTPLRPGGGVVFGPKPKDWSIKINKKESRLAVATALQSAAATTRPDGSSSVVIIEDLATKVASPKTRDFVAALKRWGVDYKKDHSLLFTTELTEYLDLATRNIETLKVALPNSLNIYDILRADRLLITASGAAYLNEKYGDAFEMLELDAETVSEIEAAMRSALEEGSSEEETEDSAEPES